MDSVPSTKSAFNTPSRLSAARKGSKGGAALGGGQVAQGGGARWASFAGDAAAGLQLPLAPQSVAHLPLIESLASALVVVLIATVSGTHAATRLIGPLYVKSRACMATGAAAASSTQRARAAGRVIPGKLGFAGRSCWQNNRLRVVI